jgi:hypothetical protein
MHAIAHFQRCWEDQRGEWLPESDTKLHFNGSDFYLVIQQVSMEYLPCHVGTSACTSQR